MTVVFEHRGQTVLVIDMARMTQDECELAARIAVTHPRIRAGSAECNADFVARWAVGSVSGLYRRAKEN